MPTDPRPTNETILELLQRVLAEVEDLKRGQSAIADDVRRLAGTANH